MKMKNLWHSKNCMRARCSLFGEPLHRANRLPIVAVVDARVVEARTEVEAPCVAVVVRDRNRRPVPAVRTGLLERSPAAGAGKKDAGRSIVTPAANNIAVHVVCCRTSPVTLALEIVKLLLSRHAPVSAPLHLRRVMIRRKNAVRRNPSISLQCVNVFTVGGRVLLLEREVRRRSVALTPTIRSNAKRPAYASKP